MGRQVQVCPRIVVRHAVVARIHIDSTRVMTEARVRAFLASLGVRCGDPSRTSALALVTSALRIIPVSLKQQHIALLMGAAARRGQKIWDTNVSRVARTAARINPSARVGAALAALTVAWGDPSRGTLAYVASAATAGTRDVAFVVATHAKSIVIKRGAHVTVV